uniref:Transposase n=1 Tax=Steinernema glaseri TaxID=37863 RepID=A0A1I7YWS3_9BILA
MNGHRWNLNEHLNTSDHVPGGAHWTGTRERSPSNNIIHTSLSALLVNAINISMASLMRKFLSCVKRGPIGMLSSPHRITYAQVHKAKESRKRYIDLVGSEASHRWCVLVREKKQTTKIKEKRPLLDHYYRSGRKHGETSENRSSEKG